MVIKFDWDRARRQGIVSGDFFPNIREHFSVKNEGAVFARYRGGFAPSRKYAITPGGRFDPGMFYCISEFLQESNYEGQIVMTKDFTDNMSVKYDFKNTSDLKLKLRDYQSDIVDRCLVNGKGVVVLATAGGKTLTIASLLESIYNDNKEFTCALIVPDLGLVEQTAADFEDYGVNFTYSKWTGKNELNVGSNVVICNLGILQSSKSDTDWLRYVDVCIVDEVHKIRRGNKVNKLFSVINTSHKFGFTGTMPEGKIDQWNVIGKIGPIIYEKNSSALRDDNYIADVKIQVLKMFYKDRPHYPQVLRNPSERYRAELDFIMQNNFRNNVLAKLCNKLDKNGLIMVDYIDHGTTLHKHLTKMCPDKKVYFIRGEVDIDDREKVKKLMEMEDNIIVVAISKIFSTGINIKNLHYIIFGSGGKAKVKIIQSIGRGLRLHKNKSKLIIFDIGDSLQYGLQHLEKRLAHYRKENIEYGIQEISEDN